MLLLQDITKTFNGQQALTDVSFEVGAAEIVGLVGASGSGKSTLARCILGLERPDRGTILWRGQPLKDRAVRRQARREIQAVFQDPRSSLNPRWTVRRILAEPLDNWIGRATGADRTARLETLLRHVSLSADLLARYPHELSTGQCQRLCIARALAPEPRLLVLDEPLSALDVLVQARILETLAEVQRAQQLGYLVITHDFAVVRDICQRVVVLDGGRVVETGTMDDVLDRPANERTRSLLEDVLPLPFAPPRRLRCTATPAHESPRRVVKDTS